MQEREVVDALLSSPNSISAVYLLAGDFSTVKQEEIDENLFNKVKLYPKVLFSVPNEFVGKVKDYIIIDAIKSFSSLSQKDNALALITKYPLNKSQDEELQKSLRDKLIAGYVDILSGNNLSNNYKRRIK